MFALIPTFDVRTTNASEQMNCSNKNGSMAVDPRSRLDHSANTMMDSKGMFTKCAEGLAVAKLNNVDNFDVVQSSTNK